MQNYIELDGFVLGLQVTFKLKESEVMGEITPIIGQILKNGRLQNLPEFHINCFSRRDQLAVEFSLWRDLYVDHLQLLSNQEFEEIYSSS
jgi:hypothetical protein